MQPVRPRSGLWADFDKLGPSSHPRARCRGCGEEIAGQPDRLKAHIANCKVLIKVDTVDQQREVKTRTPPSKIGGRLKGRLVTLVVDLDQ